MRSTGHRSIMGAGTDRNKLAQSQTPLKGEHLNTAAAQAQIAAKHRRGVPPTVANNIAGTDRKHAARAKRHRAWDRAPRTQAER